MRTDRKLSDLSISETLLLPFNLAASLLDLVFCVPIFGRVMKWIWNSVLTAGHFLVGLIEYGFWITSYQPQKKFRVGFLILRDEHGQPLTDLENVLPAITKAQEIFSDAHIKILPAFPPPKHLSESGEVSQAAYWARVLSPGTSQKLLKGGCNFAAIRQDLGVAGSIYQYHTLISLFNSGLRRLSGYGAPVTVFIVQDLNGFGGCSLGWLSDYVTVKFNSLATTAHELGHACNLFHRQDVTNLMHPSSVRQPSVHLTNWQIAMLRSSRHVTHF